MASFDEVIPPGAAGVVKAQVDTKKLRGPDNRRVDVYSNDPLQPKLGLTIQLDVLVSVQVLPALNVRVTNRGAEPRRAAVLVRRDPREAGELVVSEVASSAGWLAATARRLDAPRPAGGGVPAGEPGDWLIEVVAGPEAEYRRSTETVRFKTGLLHEPEVELPVVVDLVAPLRVGHARLDLVARAAGQPAEDAVRFSVLRGLSIDEVEIETVPPEIRVRVERQDERRGVAHVSWAGPGEGKVVFRLGDESVTLPVTWRQGDAAPTPADPRAARSSATGG